MNLILSKSGKDEYSSLVNMAGIIMGLILVLGKAKELFDYLISTFSL
ncbi:MAG: stage III sporulation AC/AD family protein [Clostridia bacterium]|nr:stage III sporulation AC/AD family protein [Clostridia bacterium]